MSDESEVCVCMGSFSLPIKHKDFLRQMHLYHRVIYAGVIFDLLKSFDFDHGIRTFKYNV